MANKSVLYIEDNRANQELVRGILKLRAGVSLQTASTGQEGLEKAMESPPDLVLLDISLPDMNGYEVYSQLQENAATRDIDVVAVSANAMQSDIDKGLTAGFVDYITKPIDIGRFLAMIDKTLL